MLAALASRWWLFVVQGVFMIILAILVFTQPTLLISLIGAYAIVDGVLKIFSGLGDQPDDQSRWPVLIAGALSLIAGIWLLANREVAIEALAYLIAAWAVVVGVLLIIWAIRLRQEINDEWLMVIFGVLSIIFGLLVFNNVLAGIISLATIFAIYMIVGGILSLGLGFRIRGLSERLAAIR
jgi:uncharacterized membrane protein HdeD (DUF308 family)